MEQEVKDMRLELQFDLDKFRLQETHFILAEGWLNQM